MGATMMLHTESREPRFPAIAPVASRVVFVLSPGSFPFAMWARKESSRAQAANVQYMLVGRRQTTLE